MIFRDAKIPGGSVVFSPKVLFSWDTDAWDMKLVVRCAVKGTKLANRGLFNGLFNGIANPVQCVQGDGGSDESGGGNESIQGGDDYAGPDLGGEML